MDTLDPISPYAPPPPGPPASTNANTAFRIFLVIAGLGGVVAMLGIAAMVWFFLPDDPLECAALIGPDTEGVIDVSADPNDPGIAALFDLFVSEMQRAQREGTEGAEVPHSGLLSFIQGMQRLQLEQVRAFLPQGVNVFFEPHGEDGAWVAALHVPFLPRGYRALFDELFARVAVQGEVPNPPIEHRGHTILVTPEGGGFCIVGSTVLITDAVPALTRVLDRLVEPPARGEIAARHAEVAARPDARAVLSMATAERLFGDAWTPAPEGQPETCTFFTAVLDAVDAHALALVLAIDCPDAEASERMRQRWAAMAAGWPWLVGEANASAEGVHASYRIDDYGERVRAWLQRPAEPSAEEVSPTEGRATEAQLPD